MSDELGPLGLRPEWIVAEQRAAEILAAVKRYNDAGWRVPVEWVEELRRVLKRVRGGAKFWSGPTSAFTQEQPK